MSDPDSLMALLARLNRIRRDHPSLQRIGSLRFHHVDGDDLLAYSHHLPAGTRLGGLTLDRPDRVLCVVNLHPTEARQGTVHLDLEAMGLPDGTPFDVHDELDGRTYPWGGSANYVLVDPAERPAHVFSVRCS